ncbi:SAM-dependent methyltransferase [Aquisalinus flavus]|uniref:Cyclopropane-fatty-acyl-phospholipid synthase n=1 Tax=Aquisalinus flavus TaxID=1526572 RepID=A0A8J2V3D8_9PROT|nr:cyclopropane-fatty-acyl-phospholipid synthase family protein [Aquisalinus flavus]MBD0426776.1 class I SAM-dependent methyltransferase [Aquisalinus flavus]UNE46630.1 class I SAM-dependent methyltransferase [Aquisalinus flavus]GGC95899.1 cyclopropane-fatty-acyl-phospholipid synthase [Aquisalinus flavus]
MSILHRVLDGMIKTGCLVVTTHDGREQTYGDGTGPCICVELTAKDTPRKIAMDPTLKLGEAYMEGELVMAKGSVYDLLDLIYRNTGPVAARSFWMRVMQWLRFARRRFDQLNTLSRSSRNVQHHYDLGDELYHLFLDQDMQYSCAYFPTPETSLDEAQLLKKRHIAAKLLARPGEDVLDIGCGWGGMGLYLARNCGVNVTGVTLSHDQLGVAIRRAVESGLADRATFKLQDYRTLDRQFDRIVSVGMFEHVGVNHYRNYFEKCAQMLKPGGVGLIHTIGRFGPPGITNPFIARYIFPGGYIPALSEVVSVIEETGLVVTDIEYLRLHYAETIRHWRERFTARWDEAKALHDERFCRMWDFYLASSEMAFRAQIMCNFQIQIAHDQTAVPMTRDYIAEKEAELAAKDGGPDCHRSEGTGTVHPLAAQ